VRACLFTCDFWRGFGGMETPVSVLKSLMGSSNNHRRRTPAFYNLPIGTLLVRSFFSIEGVASGTQVAGISSNNYG
jgi:hypothetical protein